jgi:hypothetical protein
MNRHILRTIQFSLCIVLLGTPLAHATQITLQSLGNGPSNDDFYEGFVNLSEADTEFTGLCYDFADHVSVGDTWNATITPLLSMTSNLTQWEEIAWLYTQLPTNPNAPNFSQNTSDIQWAVWSIFYSGDNPPSDSGSTTWAANAVTAISSGSMSHAVLATFSIIQPNAGNPEGTFQGFIAQNVPGAPQATPEPMTMLTIGTGLLGLGMIRRKRRTP